MKQGALGARPPLGPSRADDSRGLDYDTDALGPDAFRDCLRNLLRELLLDLQSLCEAVGEAGKLREADDAPVGDVPDVHAAEKG